MKQLQPRARSGGPDHNPLLVVSILVGVPLVAGCLGNAPPPCEIVNLYMSFGPITGHLTWLPMNLSQEARSAVDDDTFSLRMTWIQDGEEVNDGTYRYMTDDDGTVLQLRYSGGWVLASPAIEGVNYSYRFEILVTTLNEELQSVQLLPNNNVSGWVILVDADVADGIEFGSDDFVFRQTDPPSEWTRVFTVSSFSGEVEARRVCGE